MGQHKLLVTWTMSAVVWYPGDTLEDAIDAAEDSELPDDGDYVGGSFVAEPAEYTGRYLSKIAPLRARPEPGVNMPAHIVKIEKDLLD